MSAMIRINCRFFSTRSCGPGNTWEKNRQGKAKIDLHDYETIGGLSEALDRHADKAFSELPDGRSKQIAEKLFKCLIEKDPGNRQIRRATTLRQICDVADAESHEVIRVIDRFRKNGYWFLMPPETEALDDDKLIDISHESLIRKWKRLGKWVEEEAESRDHYLKTVEEAL
jgi:hypothetical protein